MVKLKETNYTIISIILLVLITALFSGCIQNDDSDSFELNSGQSPEAIIIAPEKAFFNENITFDASESQDPDGKIISYNWNMGNNDFFSGKNISYSYDFDNDFNTEIPIIYTVILTVCDNENNKISQSFQISLYPKEYVFYLSSYSKLVLNKKDSVETDDIKLKIGLISDIESLEYELPIDIDIRSSEWLLHLNFEKKFFCFLNRITVRFYDSQGSEYEELRTIKNYNILSFLNRKESITITGKINSLINLRYIGLEFQGFGLKNCFILKYFEDPYSSFIFEFKNTYDKF